MLPRHKRVRRFNIKYIYFANSSVYPPTTSTIVLPWISHNDNTLVYMDQSIVGLLFFLPHGLLLSTFTPSVIKKGI